MIKELDYIEALLGARFPDYKTEFSFAIKADKKSRGSAWVVGLYYGDPTTKEVVYYAGQSADRKRAFDLAVINVFEDKRAKIEK